MKKSLLYIFVFITLIFFCGCKIQQNIDIYDVDGVMVLELPKGMAIEPYSVKGLAYNRDVFNKNDFLLTVNAGYFDPTNKKTTSFVIINKAIIENPQDNENLINNLALKPYMDLILNRSEFRILKCGNKIKYDIDNHFNSAPEECEIIHSIQAGPMLYPSITAEEEYFISKDKDNKTTRDVIRINKKLPRTAIAIKNDKIYILISTLQSPKTLKEMHDVMEYLKVDKGLNLDGGGSTSLNYKNIEVISEKNNTARMLKSFLIVKKN